MNLGETKEPSTGPAQENKHSDDSSTNPDNQNLSSSEESPNQIVQPENQPPVEVSLPTPDSALSIDKIADAKMEVQNIESKIIENVCAQIDTYNGSLTIEDQVDT